MGRKSQEREGEIMREKRASRKVEITIMRGFKKEMAHGFQRRMILES